MSHVMASISHDKTNYNQVMNNHYLTQRNAHFFFSSLFFQKFCKSHQSRCVHALCGVQCGCPHLGLGQIFKNSVDVEASTCFYSIVVIQTATETAARVKSQAGRHTGTKETSCSQIKNKIRSVTLFSYFLLSMSPPFFSCCLCIALFLLVVRNQRREYMRERAQQKCNCSFLLLPVLLFSPLS